MAVALLRKLKEKVHAYRREIVFIVRDCTEWRSSIKLFANTVLFHYGNWADKKSSHEEGNVPIDVEVGGQALPALSR